MGYTQQAIKGVSWMSASRIITRVLAFAKIAILARLLTPSQFGLFGIASLMLALLETLTETGINVLLIQSKKDLSEYIDSAWVVSIIRGIVLGVCIILLSPFISTFFHNRESVGMLILMSAVPIVRGFINPAEVIFQKELTFKSEFWFRTPLFLFDAVIAIITAMITHSPYSLVWGLLGGAVLEVVLSFTVIKLKPRFLVKKEYFNELFQKGKWVTAYTVFNYIAENGDNIVVGRLLGTYSLGLYQMAFKISTLPISEVSDVANKVVFPVFTKISDDRKRLVLAFTKSVFVIAVVAIVVGLVIFLFPKQIILILLGEKWLSIEQILKVLAIYGVIRATIAGPGSALFLSLEKQNYVTTMTFIRLFGLMITIYPFVRLYGAIGAGYSALISVLVEVPVVLYFAFRVLK